MTPHPSSSAVQREVEPLVLEKLGASLGVGLAPRRIALPSGAFVEVDGYADGEPPLIVEVFAHQGPMKAGQVRKVLADAIKLATVRKLCVPGARAVLAFADRRAADTVSSGWRADALRAHGVDVEVVTLDAETVAEIKAAQERQRMVSDT